jgi:hypothetical protein
VRLAPAMTTLTSDMGISEGALRRIAPGEITYGLSQPAMQSSKRNFS